jgi:hypothetical protein
MDDEDRRESMRTNRRMGFIKDFVARGSPSVVDVRGLANWPTMPMLRSPMSLFRAFAIIFLFIYR